MTQAGWITPPWLVADTTGGMIQPGGSATIDLTFEAPGPGSLDATLWLVGDDAYNPDIRIPVTVNVLNPFFLPVVRR